MSIKLLAIKFNHDVDSATHDALNVRRNGVETVAIPEWRAGSPLGGAASVAAYAMRQTRGNRITIQAEFASDDPAFQAIEVRAVQPPPAAPLLLLETALSPLLWTSPQLYSYYLQANIAAWEAFTPRTPNVLGEVKPVAVRFQAGRSGFQTLELENVRLATTGVGVHTVTWQWQYRLNIFSPWTSFATTRHQIYTLLDVPALPWVQLPFDRRNTQLPWTDVLDYSCSWAAGTSTLDDAAGAITRAVNGLGAGVLEYDCTGVSVPHYCEGDSVFSLPMFFCTNFLQHLKGLYPDRYVNCVDCATIVSTFANSVGCDLWQSRMGYFFELNPTRSIGFLTWLSACGANLFYMHEVAWKNQCSEPDQVFDACLEVPLSIDPLILLPVLPVNTIFGGVGDGGYRNHLASVLGRPNCVPRPETRQRKIVV